MDYTKLIKGANDSDRFDPKKLLDLDSDEEDDGNVTPQLLKSPKKSQLPPRHKEITPKTNLTTSLKKQLEQTPGVQLSLDRG